MALLEEDAVRMATVRATEETTCLRLDRTTFHVLLGGAAAEVLRWEQRKRNNENLKKRRPTIRLQDLSLKRTLGRGMMGRVYLALDLADDTHAKIYALKSMKKAHVVATGQAGRRATHDALDAFGALNTFSAFSAFSAALCVCRRWSTSSPSGASSSSSTTRSSRSSRRPSRTRSTSTCSW